MKKVANVFLYILLIVSLLFFLLNTYQTIITLLWLKNPPSMDLEFGHFKGMVDYQNNLRGELLSQIKYILMSVIGAIFSWIIIERGRKNKLQKQH